MQSNMRHQLPSHVAIIMDGNGRWAQRRGLPRPAGHRAGGKAVRRTVEHGVAAGIKHLTLFAFSADNWQRPAPEVGALMRLFDSYLKSELARCMDNGIRLQVIGRRDRLAPSLIEAINQAEQLTAAGAAMTLRLAVDYSSRWAARQMHDPAPPHGKYASDYCHGRPLADTVPAVDLLIRSGGEQRLSDFLLLECAYAELHFTPVLWPDFKPVHLDRALGEFALRARRFGGCPQQPTHHKAVEHGQALDSI